MAATCVTLTHDASWFSYWDACAVAERVATSGHPRLVRVDLVQTTHTTTAALARLIALRRSLLQRGCDLHIIGLHGRARDLYEMTRMEGLLPRVDAEVGPRETPAPLPAAVSKTA